MRRDVLFYWIGAVAIVLAITVAYFWNGGPSRASGPAALAGRPAPSFPARTLAGANASVQSYAGRIVVMNLWASWCPPCRAEMPDLQHLYQAYNGRGVVVVGIDEGESAVRAAAFARSLGIHYPILLDQQQQYGRVYAALGLPTTFILDRSGTIAQGFDGPLSYPQMVQALRPLLKVP